MIIASAIRVTKDDGYQIIVTEKRHHNCFEVLWNLGLRKPFKEEQGFMTGGGVFLNRHNAYQYAKQAGQIVEGSHPGTLYSEDLW